MIVQGANRLNIPDGVQGGTAYQYDMTWRVHDRDLRDAVQLSGVRRSLSTGDVLPLTGTIEGIDIDVLRWTPSAGDVQDTATFEVQFTAEFEDDVARTAPSTWVVWEHSIINGEAPMPPPGVERFAVVNAAGSFVIVSREDFLALIGAVPPDPDSLVLRDEDGGIQVASLLTDEVEIQTAAGIILIDTNDVRYRLTVDTGGALVVAAL